MGVKYDEEFAQCVYTPKTSTKQIRIIGIVRCVKLKIVYGKLRCMVSSYFGKDVDVQKSPKLI